MFMEDRLKDLITKLDILTEEKLKSESELREQFVELLSSGEDSFELKAEFIAFSFEESDYDTALDEQWGTYFRPTARWIHNEIQREKPSLTDITKETIEYWQSRASQTNNLIMKTRYLALVWDFQEKIIGEKPQHLIVPEYINSLFDICRSELKEPHNEVITKIARAYDVAVSRGHKELAKESIDIAIDLEERIASTGNFEISGFCFDFFIRDGAKQLLPDQKEKIVLSLKNTFEQSLKSPSPFGTENLGLRLAKHYRATRDFESMKDTLKKVGQSYEPICATASSDVATHWYNQLAQMFHDFGMAEEFCDYSRKALQVNSEDSTKNRELHKLSDSMEEINPEILLILKELTERFCYTKQSLEQEYPEFLKHFKTQIKQGIRPVAIISPLNDDEDNNLNLIMYLNTKIGDDANLLDTEFQRIFEEHNITFEILTDIIHTCELFDEKAKVIIIRGLKNYFDGNYIDSLHILIPQIEAVIRNLLIINSGCYVRPNGLGGLQFKTLNELLKDCIVKEALTPDVCFYLRSLLAEQSGLNLRNDLCHGIMEEFKMTISATNRVLHAILCIVFNYENTSE